MEARVIHLRIWKKAVPILQDDIEQVAEQEDGECNAAEEDTNQFPTHHFLEHGGFWKRESDHRHHKRHGSAECYALADQHLHDRHHAGIISFIK